MHFMDAIRSAMRGATIRLNNTDYTYDVQTGYLTDGHAKVPSLSCDWYVSPNWEVVVKYISFDKAMKALIEGETVARANCPEQEYYLEPDTTTFRFTANDIIATDWFVVYGR